MSLAEPIDPPVDVLLPAQWAWGIDTGALRAGFGFVNVLTGLALPTSCGWREKGLGDARSLLACRSSVYTFARAMLTHFPPATIAFENPKGRFPSPTLMLHAGVIVEAVTAATGVAPWQIQVDEWKKAALGRGKVPKEDLEPWALALGFDQAAAADSDGTAAMAIAAAAALQLDPSFDVNTLRPHLAL